MTDLKNIDLLVCNVHASECYVFGCEADRYSIGSCSVFGMTCTLCMHVRMYNDAVSNNVHSWEHLRVFLCFFLRHIFCAVQFTDLCFSVSAM